MIRINPLAHAFILLMLASGCAKDERRNTPSAEKTFPAADPALAEAGRDIFYDRGFGGTGVSCADCHPDCDEAAPLEDRITPGHSIVGAAARISVWNGLISGVDLRRSASGASRCAAVFQKRGDSHARGLTTDEAAWLLAFYSAVSTGAESPVLKWTALNFPGDTAATWAAWRSAEPRIADLRGNPEPGERLFAAACSLCHSQNSPGSGPTLRAMRKSVPRLPMTVRLGLAAMPFFSTDRLSDQDVADIMAYADKTSR